MKTWFPRSASTNRIFPLMVQTAFLFMLAQSAFGQTAKQDSVDIEKLRTESGVDPTRVQSRVGYSMLIQDFPGTKSAITNRVSLNFGINRWSLSAKTEVVSVYPPRSGTTGFSTRMGDTRFSVLNAFYVKGQHAMAASAEFVVPTGEVPHGLGYFSLTPSLTYSYTIKPTLFLAVQPQYTFHLMKDPLYPDLSVLTLRVFLAAFTKSGMFFVVEPRPVFDLGNNTTDFVFSPIVGKSLGSGFNLIGLAEIPFTNPIKNARGTIYQIGFNKNF